MKTNDRIQAQHRVPSVPPVARSYRTSRALLQRRALFVLDRFLCVRDMWGQHHAARSDNPDDGLCDYASRRGLGVTPAIVDPGMPRGRFARPRDAAYDACGVQRAVARTPARSQPTAFRSRRSNGSSRCSETALTITEGKGTDERIETDWRLRARVVSRLWRGCGCGSATHWDCQLVE